MQKPRSMPTMTKGKGNYSKLSVKSKKGESFCCCCSSTDLGESSFNKLQTPKNNSERDEYVQRLESEFAVMQNNFLNLLSQNSRVQFQVRQILQASPCERSRMLRDLEKASFDTRPTSSLTVSHTHNETRAMGNVRSKQMMLIHNLRDQLSSLTEAIDMPLESSSSDLIRKNNRDIGDGKHVFEETKARRVRSTSSSSSNRQGFYKTVRSRSQHSVA